MATSHNPPDYLLAWLFSVEQAVVAIYKIYPQINDKEVETIYDQFQEFFKQLAKGKEMYEPISTIAARQALIDAILQAIDIREELGGDDQYIMASTIQPGGYPIPCFEALYASGFGYLSRSARFWRKQNGPKGYLKFISEQLPS